MRITISNGEIIDPANNLHQTGDIFIDQGRIVGVGQCPDNFIAEQKIDASQQIVCPGLIDLCAYLYEPGQEHKATIYSETAAAAASGITTICCLPDTVPVIDEPSVVELVLRRSANSQQSKVFPIGALTDGLKGKALAAIDTLKSAGCIAVSNANIPINDTEVLRRALEYAKTCNLTVHLYCQDGFLSKNGVMHEGIMSVRLGLSGIPAVAETIAISRALLLIEQIGTRVHFCRISTASGLSLIADAKSRGLEISADVSIANLHLTDVDVNTFNTDCFILPPLREEQDKEALRAGLTNGTISNICSNHQPHQSSSKNVPFSMAEPGASTIEMLLPLTLSLVQETSLTMSQAIAALTSLPAHIIGAASGNLSVGTCADICIFDPQAVWTVDRNKLLSAGKNTPFDSWSMRGQVTHTIIDGNIIYQRH